MGKELFSVILILFLFTPGVAGHVPLLPPEGDGLEEAVFIEDPIKSWAIYGDLKANSGNYYTFDLKEGDRLRLSLFSPYRDFSGRMALMGVNVQQQGSIPQFIEVPSGYNFSVIEREVPQEAEYEPFTPTSYYYFADFDKEMESGTYYVAVFTTDQEERYGLVIGYKEDYNLLEWLGVPLDIIGIRLWEGQSLPLILAPMLTTLVAGLVVIRKFQMMGIPSTPNGWLASIGGLLVLGSSPYMLLQIAIALTRAPLVSEVAVTLLFVIISLFLGALTIRTSFKNRFSGKDRLFMVILALASLLFWSGLYVGPALVLASVIKVPE